MTGYVLLLILTSALAGQIPTPTAVPKTSPATKTTEVKAEKRVAETSLAIPPATVSPKPESPLEKALREAQDLYETDKIDASLAKFKEAIGLDPKSAEAYIGVASCHYSSKEFDKAIGALKRAVELDPKNSFIYYKLGRCYASKEQWDLAAIEYKKAIKDNPKNPFIHFEMASTYFIKSDFHKAKEHYEQAAKLFGYDTPPGEDSLRNAIKVEMLMKRIGGN